MPQIVNNAFAVFTMILLLLIWRGLFTFSLRADKSPTYHLAMGTCAILWAVVFRAAYWDVLPVFVNAVEPGLWAQWGEASGWTAVNIIWDLLLIFGAYHLLTALRLLIPEAERADWPLWRAPFYPHGHIVGRVIRRIRGRK